MDSIRLKNLRGLSDTEEVPIRPIMLLVGQNNSGKSTFLRTLPLLRQSVEARTEGPILWYGPLVDFGSFKEALRRGAAEPEITIGFKFQLPMVIRRLPDSRPPDNAVRPAGVSITIAELPSRELSFVKQLLVTFAGHEVDMTFDSSSRVTQFRVNGRDFSGAAASLRGMQQLGMLLPRLFLQPARDARLSSAHVSALRHLMVENVRALVLGEVKRDDRVDRLIERFRLAPSEVMLSDLQSASENEPWQDVVLGWTTSTPEFVQLRDLVVANRVSDLLQVSNDHISMFAKNVRWTGPVRATAERYYRLQNLAVDEVDSQGQNLAMFLHSLTGAEEKRFAAWTEALFGFAARASGSGAGHVSLTLKESGGVTEQNLADTGFGFSQILPIVTQLWSATSGLSRKRFYVDSFGNLRRDRIITLAIEQPELHLHPHLQARLVDSMVQVVRDSRESGLQLKMVLETHSETIVNRFGIRVASGDLSKDDICVLLFEKRGADADTRVTRAGYDDEGFLTNWPFGFFEPKEG